MSWAEVTEFIDKFRTDKVMEQLHTWDIGDLSTNPWFLGGFAVAIITTYFIGWRVISAFLVGIGGFTLALSYTVAQGTGTKGLEGDGLFVIVGGGAAAIALFIYILFVKSE